MPEVLSYVCPYCGSEVRVGDSCAGCRKKVRDRKLAKKSWEQDASADGLDLPDGDFDYDEFVGREFGKVPHRATGLRWYWWLLAVAVLGAMIAGVFLAG